MPQDSAAPIPILVVDDEKLVRDTMCELLAREGYVPAGFGDPMAALASLAGVDYRLALIDLSMPVMDGISVIELAMSIRPTLGCLIVTGEGDRASSRKALDAGAVDYLLKPFDIVAVRAALGRALRTVRLRDKLLDADQKAQQYLAEMAMLHRQLVIARSHAELANEAKSRILASLGQELLAPLNAIIGLARILHSEEPPKTPAQVAEFSGHVLDGARRLQSLVSQVLDLAQLDSGKPGLQIAPVALDEALGACSELLAADCTAHAVTLDFPVSAGHRVLADPDRLRQVLLNLLTNAIRYNRPGGSVTVSIGVLPAGETAIAITDSGAGIAPELVGTLFEPFDSLGRDLPRGRPGIGLTLVGRLVAMMNGRIDVDSVAGQGSIFTVVLPTATAAVAAAQR